MRYFFVTLLVIPFFVQAQQWRNVLIGTYTNNGSHGIYTAKMDIKTSAFQITDSTAIENPSFLAFSPNKKFVYAVVENGKDKPGKVAAFTYDTKTAKISFLNEVLSGGDHPCHLMVHPSGKTLAVANYNGGNFSLIQINEDGSLNGKINAIQHYGSSIDTTRQKSPHVHQTVFSKDGTLLYVTDLGIDKVKIYAVFVSNKGVTINDKPVEEISLTAGNGPRHIALSKNEKELFVLNELKGSISYFKKNDDKRHKYITTVIADSISTKPGSAQILLSKNNKFVYASNRADANTITVFKNSKGTLQHVQTIPTMGVKPRNFILTPNEKFLLVANQVSNTVQVFKVNKDGTLSINNQSLQIPSPVCIIID